MTQLSDGLSGLRPCLGATVEVGDSGLTVPNPVVNIRLPGVPGNFVADSDRAILSVDDVGTFAIAHGERICLDPVPGVTAAVVQGWLNGTVAALLLAQRRCFALHASVIDIGGSGIALSGQRGAGKSTTALRLTQSGHPLVTDDVSPLDTGDPVTVHPFGRPLHVSPDTAADLGIDLAEAGPILPGHAKHALPIPPRPALPIAAIAVLGTDDAATSVHAVRIRGMNAHGMVSRNIYRGGFLRALWQNEMFTWSATVAAKVAVYELTRPPRGWTVEAVAEAVENIARQTQSSTPL